MSGRGGFIHEKVVLDRLVRAARVRGATVCRQVQAGSGRGAGHIDLVLARGGRTIAVEVELSPKRVNRDLRKAAAIGADELWIVVPHRRTADAVGRRLAALAVSAEGSRGIFVLTLGQALQRIEHCFSLFSGAHVQEKRNRASDSQTPRAHF